MATSTPMCENVGVCVEQVSAPVQLGEGPHYDSREKVLYFVSIFDRTIHMYDPATNHTYTGHLEGKPTFIIPVEGRPHHFAVGLGRTVVEVAWDPRAASSSPSSPSSGKDTSPKVLRVIAEVDKEYPDNRFNDAKADPRGRLFAGTMGAEYSPGQFRLQRGALYRVGPAGDPTRLADRLDISNGLCWDEARAAFYFADSFRYTIQRYDYDVDTGHISNPRTVFRMADHGLEGIVDGMTIDTDGNLWFANFDGHQVVKVDPVSGRVLQKVRTPALQTTSVCWGGDGLDQLYVTSAALERGGERQLPPAGGLFRVSGLGARGVREHCVHLD